MEVRPEISFRDVPRTPAIEELIAKKVDKLNRLCPELISCRIAVELPHNRHRTGNLYRVRVDMQVPDQELCVRNEEHDEESFANLHTAIRLVFQRAERQLKAYTAKKQRQTREKALPAVGVVSRIEEGRGIIETPDGREFYFDDSSLLEGRVDELTVGQQVSFGQTNDDRPSHAIGIIPTAGTD